MPSKGKVLAVDDDPIALRITCARLESAGFEVSARAEALGTSKAIADVRPDVVLLDVNMPALSGEGLARLLLRRFRAALIFHSSVEQSELGDIVRRAGAVGAIAKTGDDARFLAEFERLFRQIREATP